MRLVMECPEFIAVGHVTYDIYPEEKLIGGSAAYSSLTAHKLSISSGMITSRGLDFSCDGLLKGINIVGSLSHNTTTFCNSYYQGKRKQIVKHVANKIKKEHIPSGWDKAKIVHICPVADEVNQEIFDLFKDSLVGLTPQGLMRRWGRDGKVYPKKWIPTSDIASKVEIMIFSDEDIAAFPEVLEEYKSLMKIVIITRGDGGSILYWDDKEFSFPAFKTEEKDPTGAGDVFAAAFLVKYYQTGDPIESSCFANCAASFAVEEKGTLGIPNLNRVIKRVSMNNIEND